MGKIVSFCFFALAAVQMACCLPRTNDDLLQTSKLTDVSKEVDDALNVLRESFQNLVKVVQDNAVVKDFNEKIQTFTSDVAIQGKMLAQKIQNVANID